ncbi:MAG: hypothetical protein IJ356_00245 [Erysipelotrichaceae bacterium]|nr:hypothetical protein [Erysipelotrichaceae bacterium]
MEKKIRKNMIVISVLIALITYICSSVTLYLTMMLSVDKEVRHISNQIIHILEDNPDALHSMTLFSESRITLIDEYGTVLFDSIKDSASLENHESRPELIQAKEKGIGRSLRFSTSLSTQTYYYAVHLDNGSTLRIATETHTLNDVFISGLIVSGAAMILIMILAAMYSKKLTENIIRPINQIDFSHPLKNQTYPELKPLLENLDRHDKMRKEFSANVSHELKTPLTSISGYAEIMANGLVKEEDIPTFSQKIYDESRNLFHRIEDIIRISKLDEADLPSQLEDIDYCAVIESILSNLEKQINEKNITVTIILPSVTGKGLISVAEEIFYNLIENAVKYNKYNGEIFIQLSDDTHNIYVKIKDTGIGISQEDLPRIYERFFRSDRSHSHTIEGSGLGLSIVKHGIALLKGEISVESKLNHGTTFHILLKKH